MPEIWRIIDTGLRSAAQNIALNRALLEARRAEEIPSTLRFLRFTPCALIGCSQSLEQEVDIAYCRSQHIELQRRITGGDLMCLDPGQLVWELYLHRRDVGALDLRAVSRRLCHAAATAVSALGIDARLRARGEIEVDGRRIADSAGVCDGDALLYQGSLLVDADPGVLLRASRLAAGTLDSARERFTSVKGEAGPKADIGLLKHYLREAFESDFGIEFSEGDLTLSEHARFQAAVREIDHAAWVEAVSRPAAELPVTHASSGASGTGPLQVTVAYDRQARIIRQARFTSAVAIAPRRTLADLENALLYTPLDRLAYRTERFFASLRVEMAPLRPQDFIEAVQRALAVVPTRTVNENGLR